METVKNVLLTIWRAWKKFGELMGEIVGRVFLMVFYVTIALPFGLGTRLFGDPLDIRDKTARPAWVERKPIETSVEAAYRQF